MLVEVGERDVAESVQGRVAMNTPDISWTLVVRAHDVVNTVTIVVAAEAGVIAAPAVEVAELVASIDDVRGVGRAVVIAEGAKIAPIPGRLCSGSEIVRTKPTQAPIRQRVCTASRQTPIPLLRLPSSVPQLSTPHRGVELGTCANYRLTTVQSTIASCMELPRFFSSVQHAVTLAVASDGLASSVDLMFVEVVIRGQHWWPWVCLFVPVPAINSKRAAQPAVEFP
mmetsp:Transcript_11688/g.26044  ORF Transcript_11688/g.26044 Transcript_11688/m.26044 type:complete len:226 (+) Transcript_11688:266-943(+)